MPLKLAVLATDWGRQLHELALLRGVKSTLLTPYVDPTPASTVFARLPQRSPEAGRAWALRHLHAGGKSVQSEGDLTCYENRGAQMALLADHMPRGEKVRTMEAAEEAIETLGLPIVSKAPFGSSSHTVRALHTKDEARAEAAAVLHGGGLGFRGLGVQVGECLWQEFMPHNQFALRVAMVSNRLGWAFKVMNRAHDWRASGSGNCVPLTAEEWATDRYRYAINTATEAARALGSRWCAFDLLWDHRSEHGRWRVVDVTLAWNMSRQLIGGNYDAPVYDLWLYKRDEAQRHGRDQWGILLETLLDPA